MRIAQILAFLSCSFLIILPAGLQAGERQVVIVDPYSGFAIGGYDPLTYFIGKKPMTGIDGFEARWGGVSWRFINSGNRRAFLISPHVYMPQYGGYDPVALAQGLMTEGDPLVYTLYKDRLYFFFSVYAREDFLVHTERILRGAEQGWQRLKENH